MVSRLVPRRGVRLRVAVGASFALATFVLGGCAWGTASGSASPTGPVASAAEESSAHSSAPSSSAPSAQPSASHLAVATTPAPSPSPSADASPHPATPHVTPPPPAATVAVTYALWDTASVSVEVAGYVADAVESDGTCTLTLTSAGRTVSVTQKASPDATTTSCGMLSVPRAKLPASGAWSAVLGYASSEHAGSSPAVTVEVP